MRGQQRDMSGSGPRALLTGSSHHCPTALKVKGHVLWQLVNRARFHSKHQQRALHEVL